jgi:uncharacterized membrane protein YhaH (DUF805 family)
MENIFNEDDDTVFHRFSTITLCLFIYHIITYYGILKYHMKCQNLPNFYVILLLIIFHIIQVIMIKKLHDEEQWIWMWILVIGPMFFYVCVMHYYDYLKKEQSKRINLMLYQMQQQNQPTLLTQAQQQPPPNGLYTDPNSPLVQNYLNVPPQNLNPVQMNAIMNSNDIPAYGDYVSQFNSMNMAQPFNKSALNPYVEHISPF